jgi:hypothetical protein
MSSTAFSEAESLACNGALQNLRKRFPLATVSAVQSVLTGTVEAQVLVPTEIEAFQMACTQVASSTFVHVLTRISKLAFLMAVAVGLVTLFL